MKNVESDRTSLPADRLFLCIDIANPQISLAKAFSSQDTSKMHKVGFGICDVKDRLLQCWPSQFQGLAMASL